MHSVGGLPTVSGNSLSWEESELRLAAVQQAASAERGREQAALQLEESLKSLSDILKTREKREALLALKSGHAQVLIDFMYSSLSLSHYPESAPPWLRKHTLIALRKLCEHSGLYPRWFALNDISIDSTHADGGGFCDIHKGRWSNGQKLCLKVVRLYQKSDINQLLRHCSREAIIWGQLNHPNIVPFYGIYYLDSARTRVCLVSPWQVNGNIVVYLQKTPQAPRKQLCYGVASGLSYLHDQSIIHGDLKGLNVLITSTGEACITDFGLSIIKSSKTLGVTATKVREVGRTDRWASPELLLEDDSCPSYASDVWALGCVCYEILTRLLPFHTCSKEVQIIGKLLKGGLPARLDEEAASLSPVDHIDEPMKILIKKCWSREPKDRPSVLQILEGLEQQGLIEPDATEQLGLPIQSSTETQQGLIEPDSTERLDLLMQSPFTGKQPERPEIRDRQQFQDAMSQYSGVLADLFLVQATLKRCGLLDSVVGVEGVQPVQGVDNLIIVQQNVTTLECLMCSGEYPQDLVVHVENCEHLFCRGCLRDHTRAKIFEKRYPIFCPLCTMDNRLKRGVISESVIRGIGLSQEDYEAFRKIAAVPQPLYALPPPPPPPSSAPPQTSKPNWSQVLVGHKRKRSSEEGNSARAAKLQAPLTPAQQYEALQPQQQPRRSTRRRNHPSNQGAPVGGAQAAPSPEPGVMGSLNSMGDGPDRMNLPSRNIGMAEMNPLPRYDPYKPPAIPLPRSYNPYTPPAPPLPRYDPYAPPRRPVTLDGRFPIPGSGSLPSNSGVRGGGPGGVGGSSMHPPAGMNPMVGMNAGVGPGMNMNMGGGNPIGAGANAMRGKEDLNNMFSQEFMQGMANALDDIDPSLFKPDGDFNYERDFGQWFNHPDDPLDLK